MPDDPDMSEVVTRAILREELSKELSKALEGYATKADLANHPTKAELREELAKFATKAELREILANYPTKAELREELSRFATKHDLEMWGGALFERMRTEMLAMETRLETRLASTLATQTRAIFDETARRMGIVDEKYNDLPARVTRLEDVVYAPKRRRR